MEIVSTKKYKPSSPKILSSNDFNKVINNLQANTLKSLDLNLKFGIDSLDQRIETLIRAITNINITITSLTSLILSDNDITDDQAKRILSGIQNNRNLTILNLSYNKIGAEGARALAEIIKLNPNLKTFDISSNTIKDDGAIAIAEAINENRTLELLNLSYNQIRDQGVGAIALAIKQNPNLTSLDLSYNQIGAEGARAVAEVIEQNPSLKSLSINYNPFGDEGARAIAKAIKEKDISKMELVNNQIGDQGAVAIAEAIKQKPNLTSLDLSYNQIGVEGVRAIAEAIKQKPNLTSLDLSNNNIGDEGAKAIAEAINLNPNLTSLNLSNNNIGPEGAEAIAEAIKQNTNLTSLYMDDNKLGDAGASFLAGGISINKGLINLSLSNNNIGTLGFSSIIAGIYNNINLIKINLDGNIIGTIKPNAYNEMKELYFNFRALWDKESASGLNLETWKSISLKENPIVQDWTDILYYKRSSYNEFRLTNFYETTSGGYKSSKYLDKKRGVAKTKFAELDIEFDSFKSARGGFANAPASGGRAEEPEQTAEESRPFPNFGAELRPFPEQQLEGFGEPHEKSEDELTEQILYVDSRGSSDGDFATESQERIEEMQALQQSIWDSLQPRSEKSPTEFEEAEPVSGRFLANLHGGPSRRSGQVSGNRPSNGGHRGESSTGFGGSAEGSAGQAYRPSNGGHRGESSTGFGGSAEGSAGQAYRPTTGGIRLGGFRPNPLASPATLPEKNNEGEMKRKASTGLGGSAGEATPDEIKVAKFLSGLRSALSSSLIPEDSNGGGKGRRKRKASTGLGGSAGPANREGSLDLAFTDEETGIKIFESDKYPSHTQKQHALMFQRENLRELEEKEGSPSVEGKRPGGQPAEGGSRSLHEIIYENRNGRRKTHSSIIEISSDGEERMVSYRGKSAVRYSMRQTPARLSANAGLLNQQEISQDDRTEEFQEPLGEPSSTSSVKASNKRPNPNPENPENPKKNNGGRG